MDKAIKVTEYQARRKQISAQLKDAVGVVFAGAGARPRRGVWLPVK